MSTAVRSSKCSSTTKPGDPTPVDLNAAGSGGQGVGFTSRIERADIFAGVSSVVDLLPPSLQPTAGGVGSVTIGSGGTGYTAGVTTGSIVGGGGSGAHFKVTATGASGAATAVEITAFGSGYTLGSSVTLVGGSGTNATGTLHSPLHGKKVTLEVFLSPVDCTDLNNFPTETNAVKGGGLVPTSDQLNKFFAKQFTNPVSLTYSDTLDRRQSIAVCVVSQTYLCVQASVAPDSGSRYSTTSSPKVPTDSFQILARIESYLFPQSLPLLDSQNGNVNPDTAATETTLSSLRDSSVVISNCVTNNHLAVDILNTPADALSVGLVKDGSAVSGTNQLPVLATLGVTDSATLTDVKTATEAGKASLASIDGKASDLSDIKTNTAATTTALGANLNTVLQLGGSAVSASNPLPIITPKFVKTVTFTGNANAGLTTQAGANLSNLTVIDLGSAASKCKFTMKWDRKHTKSSHPTASMVVGFLLSFADVNNSAAFNGLLRFETDTVHDQFSDGSNNYMSVNLNLGHVPRYMYLQCEGPVAGSVIACMDNLDIRIFCEK